jgi:predicted anti-sigma-YlaC factor YlaD
MKSILALAVVAALSGCSIRQYALDHVSDALAGGGSAFAADDDPELVRAAAPFSLKLTESLLAENPRHAGLLLAATRGFTQYAYAFVQQEAEELEEQDLMKAAVLQERARRLYRRARDYGLRAMALQQPNIALELQRDPQRAAARFGRTDAALLYWTAASWGALIGLGKDNPELLAELPVMEALIDRALELDESFERGAIHTFLIGYEAARQGASGDPASRARAHFARAVELSAGGDASPYVALAESVSVPQQRRDEFERLLRQALGIDVDGDPKNRLPNLVSQRRARWLLSRTGRLFTD